MERTLILDHEEIKRKIDRIAFQIYEENAKETSIIIAGIASRGFTLATLIAESLKTHSPLDVIIKEIRLDKSNSRTSELSVDIKLNELENKTVIVVDDVLNSGKTLIYGVRFFLDHPVKRIMTAVLVDRSHRNFPVTTDFAGIRLSTTLQQHIHVVFEDKMQAYLE